MQTKITNNDLIFPELCGYTDGLSENKITDIECLALLILYKQKRDNILPNIRKRYLAIPKLLFPILDIAWPYLVSTDSLIKKIMQSVNNENYGLMLQQIKLYINSRDCSNPFRNHSKEWLQGNVKWISHSANFLELNKKLQDLNVKTEVKKSHLIHSGNGSNLTLFKLLLLSSQLVNVFGAKINDKDDIPLHDKNYFPVLHEFISEVDAYQHWLSALLHVKNKEFQEAILDIDQCIEKDSYLKLYYLGAKQTFLEAMNNTKELAKFYMQVGEYQKVLPLQLKLQESDAENESLKDDLQITRYFNNDNNTYDKIITQKKKNPLELDDVWLKISESNFAPVEFLPNSNNLVAIKLIDVDSLYKKVNFDCEEVNQLYVKMLAIENVSEESCNETKKLANDILQIIGNDVYFNHQSFLVLINMIAVLRECNTDEDELIKHIENTLSLYKFNPRIYYLYSHHLSNLKKYSNYPLLEAKRISTCHQSLRFAMLFATHDFNDFAEEYENNFINLKTKNVPMYASEYNQKQIVILLNRITDRSQKAKIAQILLDEMKYVIKDVDASEFIKELSNILLQNKKVRVHKEQNIIEKVNLSNDNKEKKENEKTTKDDKKIDSKKTKDVSSYTQAWWVKLYILVGLVISLISIVSRFWPRSKKSTREVNPHLVSFVSAPDSDVEGEDPNNQIVDLGLVRAKIDMESHFEKDARSKNLNKTEKKPKIKQSAQKKMQVSKERLSKEEDIDDKLQSLKSNINPLFLEKTRLYQKLTLYFDAYENLLEKLSKLNLKDSDEFAMENLQIALSYINNAQNYTVEVVRIAKDLKQNSDELRVISSRDFTKTINENSINVLLLKEQFSFVSDGNSLKNLEENLENLSKIVAKTSEELIASENKIKSLRDSIILQNNHLLTAVKESSKGQKLKKSESQKNNKKHFKHSHGSISAKLNDENTLAQQKNTNDNSKKSEELEDAVETKSILHVDDKQAFEQWCLQVKKLRLEFEAENKKAKDKKIISNTTEKPKDEKLSMALFHAKMLSSLYHAMKTNTFKYTNPVFARATLLHSIRMIFALSISLECKKDTESSDIANQLRNKLVYGWYKILGAKNENIYQQFVSTSDESLLYVMVKSILPKIENIIARKNDTLDFRFIKKRLIYQSLVNLTKVFKKTETIDYIITELELINKLNDKLQRALLDTTHKTQVDSIVMSLTIVGQLGRSIHFDHKEMWLKLKEITTHSQFYSIELLKLIDDIPDNFATLKEVFYKELMLLKEIADKKRNYFDEGYTPLLNLLTKLAGEEYCYKLLKKMSLFDFLNLCNEMRKSQYHDLTDLDNILEDVFVFEKLSSHFIYDLIQLVPVHLKSFRELNPGLLQSNTASPGR